MTQINLLPWREQARQKKRWRFLFILIGFVVLTLFMVMLLHIYYSVLISNHNSEIILIQSSLAKEEVTLADLNKENQDKTKIDLHVKFLIGLRKRSFDAVRLLDELPRVIPEAVSLTHLVRENNNITLIGKAGSNLQVTLFMENIGKSKFFKQPVLTEISSKENASGDERFFQLKVEQKE